MNNPHHLLLSVGELEENDKAAQCEEFGQGCKTKYSQQFQKEIEYLRYFGPELEFEGKVVLGPPDVATEYRHGNTLNRSNWFISKYNYHSTITLEPRKISGKHLQKLHCPLMSM